jgi:hypothetical protein
MDIGIGKAEYLVAVMYDRFGSVVSNSVIHYMLKDDTRDVAKFLVFMLEFCGERPALACADVLKFQDKMPQLRMETLVKLFETEEEHGADSSVEGQE